MASRADSGAEAGTSAGHERAVPAAIGDGVPRGSSAVGGVGVRRKPIVVILVGMAGCGKTTLMQQLCAHVSQHGIRSYVLNLDPAVLAVPYPANIDIRDTVNYKNVMKEYRLGPNGGILTSLNLFATKIHEVLALVERRADSLDIVLLDTPGQIEIFTWSASGAIITEAFASSFPTVIAYVVDTPRSTNPGTFMSNMLYACGIVYKTRLPLLLTFNKTDVAKHEFALEWMKDLEVFQAAIDQQDSSYASGLNHSLCLVLDEFYNNLSSVGVSALTGHGLPALFKAVEACGVEYEEGYGMDLQRRKEAKLKEEEERQRAHISQVEKDLAEEGAAKRGSFKEDERGEEEDEEEEEEEEEA